MITGTKRLGEDSKNHAMRNGDVRGREFKMSKLK